MIRFVRHDLINKGKWDDAINQSINAYAYAYSYFLDAVTDGHWDALIKDDYEVVMPLPFSVKFGIKYIHQPAFNQQLGIFYKQKCSNFDIIELFQSIPKNIKFLELNFNKYLFDRIPSQFVAASNNNYELEIMDDYKKINQNYSSNLKRNLKKASSFGLQWVRSIKPEDLVHLFSQNKGSQLRVYKDIDYQRLTKLIFALMHRGQADIIGVTNDANTLIGAALFVKDNNRKIFLFSGLNEEGKEKGAMPYLIDNYIKQYQNSHFIMDFEGSNNENLARFYAGFGATKFQYQRILINNLPFPLKQFKRFYSKSIK